MTMRLCTFPGTCSSPGSRVCKMGSEKVAVLPEPVWDWPITSRPLSIIGMMADWMGVGSV